MFLEANIERLQRHPLHMIGVPSKSDFKLEYVHTNDGIDFFKNEEGNILKVEDYFNQEAAANPHMRQLVFAFGINSPKELNALYKTLNKTSLLVILEPHSSLFNVALNNKNLKIFENDNVILFNNNISKLQEFLLNLLKDFNHLSLVNNMHFYLTYYYRNYDFELTKKFIKSIRQIISAHVNIMGNSIEDSLEGLENNLRNIDRMLVSKNPHFLKDKYKGKPAIIISAGPSLEKNLHYLKEIQGKAIVFAVDTVIKKVLNLGIVPDFVCSVERVERVYDYFYKDTNIPENVTLVAPPLLDPRIFAQYKGKWVLPYRLEVAEYQWLLELMKPFGEHLGIGMGSSCAHVAFGMASHIGASPIILIGQDLAYDNTGTQSHVTDTIYDTLEDNPEFTKKIEYVDGYYGEKVTSNDVWIMFRLWFEEQITKHHLKVIDATEGGAKIAGTTQMSLKEAIETYCIERLDDVYSTIKKTPSYDFSVSKLKASFEQELKVFIQIREEAYRYLHKHNELNISALTIRKNLMGIQSYLDSFDEFVKKSTSHPLMLHNIQGFVLKTSWDLSAIEDIISVKNLQAKKAAQIKFLIVIISTSEKIEALLEQVIQSLDKEIQKQKLDKE